MSDLVLILLLALADNQRFKMLHLDECNHVGLYYLHRKLLIVSLLYLIVPCLLF